MITNSDNLGISRFKAFLQSKFQTKDLGALQNFIGIEITQTKKGIFLSQRKYAL